MTLLTRPPHSSREGVYCALACALSLAATLAGCVRSPRPVPQARPAETRAVLDALAARQQAMRGLRLSMRVRAAGAGTAALVAVPAYLAIDAPDAVRLQVLSPFGVTVLDLTIRNGAYELVQPLRGETRRGLVDLAALARPGALPDERMALALALLFHPKIRAATCRGETLRTVTCPVAAGIVAHITVDDVRRIVAEAYARPDGRPLLDAAFTDYADDSPIALPGRIDIHDAASGATLRARVVRAHVVGVAGNDK